MWVRVEKGQRLAFFLTAFLLIQSLIAAQKTKGSVWPTLSGSAPQVIAFGGFSGLFPASSLYAYQFQSAVAPNSISWCDVQLTKDGVPVCLPNITLQNCTNIQGFFPQGQKTYIIDGVSTTGWFPVDYTYNDLANISLIQGIFSRPSNFDNFLPILNVQFVIANLSATIWLNIQHDIFYSEHNLSVKSAVLSISQTVPINYISSPEVGFLSGLAANFRKSNTKLIFSFLDADSIEPSTNKTYGSLLKNLTLISTFASGILVPKNYIWPVTSDQYILPHTSVVADAHKSGLEIYASGFANDVGIPYNFSYDPLAEALSYVDNGDFSVDGIVTAFPLTPSAAIGCYSHLNTSQKTKGELVIISHNGASGIYPDCTDLAYEQAVNDGADFIDCPVQLTQDGVLVCMSSINLLQDTTVTSSSFRNLVSTIPELGTGIFTFNLTWKDIKENLKPVISSPEHLYNLARNPRYINAGNFTSLSDFLAFAKGKSLSGVFIIVENAAFIAENLGVDVVDAVISNLNASGYNNNETELQVVIQSTNSSVLEKFKKQTKYKINYKVDESIRNADPPSLSYIKTFADSVSVDKQSIYPESRDFITEQTVLVQTLQSAGLPVYVYVLRNEFISQDWDFFSDPYVEVNSFVQTAGVNGTIVDFPATPSRYLSNSCQNLGNQTPTYALPVPVGTLLSTMQSSPATLPPALAPLPVLDTSDIVEPPLPPATETSQSAPTPAPELGPPPPGPSSSPARIIPNSVFLATALMAFASIFVL